MAGDDDDRRADFEAFCGAQWPPAVRLARLLTAPSVSDDQVAALVTDALAETYERWGRGDPGEMLRRRVVARCGATDRRGPGARHDRGDDDGEPYAALVRPDPIDALAALPVGQRTAIVLRHHDGLSDHDIALAIGTADERVDALVADGLARLREVAGR